MENQRRLNELSVNLEKLKLTLREKNKLKIMNDWVQGNIISINSQEINLVKAIKTRNQCDKCRKKALYQIDNTNYCWTHLYLTNLIKIN